MMKSRTVIKQEYLPMWAKVWAMVVAIVCTASIAFTAGVVVAQYQDRQRELNPPPAEVGSLILPSGRMYAEYVEPKYVEPKPKRWQYSNLNKEIKCLAQNLYHEGRDQDIAGQIAINLVVLNRVKSKHYPDSICKVVWQQNTDKRSGKKTAQFSWTLDGQSDKIHEKEAYADILRLSRAMLAGGSMRNFVDISGGATHYHADYVKPYWAKEDSIVAQLDSHIFYRLY